MSKLTVYSLILMISMACTEKRTQNERPNPENETPEVLENDKNRIDISSYNKSRGYDIIDELFEEAINKDEQLRSITERIEDFEEFKKDSLAAYQDYMGNMQSYWTALSTYSHQISDSTTREEINQLIARLKEKHKENTDALTQIVSQIDSSRKILKDQEIIMKIIVTEPMMNNYLRNEIPDVKTLESINGKLDSLMEDIEPYTQIEK